MEKRVTRIIKTLNKLYPHPRPFLQFRSPFESLVATILSAQCTDERVNKVTPALFRAAGTPEKTLALGTAKLQNLIRSTGFYRAKTKNLLGMCRILIQKHAGRVPSDRNTLKQLPGVGRKTASVVLAQSFGIPTFPVDRHVLRVANRLALAHAETADATSEQLEKNIPRRYWIPLHIQLISHGRTICRPKPKCHICPLLPYCPEGQKRMPAEKHRAKK